VNSICIKCHRSSPEARWADNGFACPSCHRWFCGALRRNYLAAHPGVVRRARLVELLVVYRQSYDLVPLPEDEVRL